MSEVNLPDLVVIVHSAEVAANADESWRKIGSFFDLGRFLDVDCSAAAGTGNLGSIRVLNGAVVESVIGCTPLSYTYDQSAGPMSAHAYHGTVSCEPKTEGSCILTYTLVYDQRGIAAENRSSEQNRISSRFENVHAKMAAVASGAE